MAKKRARTRSGITGSAEALRRATAVLEVLGGLYTPTEAAGALGIGVPRYYMLETQALEGLVKACEPRGRGPGQSPAKVIREQSDQIQRLESEVRRLQALVRVSNRALGVAGLKTPASSAGGRAKNNRMQSKKGRARRTPVTRALGMSKLLKEKAREPAEQGMASGGGRGGVAAGAASPGGDPAHDRG